MLSSIRKFSTTIYAKILLGIVVIPFVFWGMGTSFTGGSKNVIVKIDKEKYSTQDFVNYIQEFAATNQKIDSTQIDNFLTKFVSDKLMEKEIEYFDIKISDESLGHLIKHQKEFERENTFSRTEYEKFLLEMNLTAATFEANLAKHEKKKQLLNIIGGGVIPAKFFVISSYDKINQKRDIQFLNLNNLANNESDYTEEKIKLYYESNKDDYKEIFKYVNLLELSPKNLTGDTEFSDLFFKKIDEIDDMIAQGTDLNFIIKEFNLNEPYAFTLNRLGVDLNSKKITNISKKMIKNIFGITDSESLQLIENEEKYFILEIVKTENIQKKISENSTKKKVLANMKKNKKRKLISEIISKINQNNFNKSDFDKLADDKKLPIKKASLKNSKDDKIFNIEFLNSIYTTPVKKIIIVHDIFLTENFLVYIDAIKNVTIDEKTDEYNKYFNISRNKISNNLLNTYDSYIKKKYEIDINYKALEEVKNYFN